MEDIGGSNNGVAEDSEPSPGEGFRLRLTKEMCLEGLSSKRAGLGGMGLVGGILRDWF